MNNPEDFIAETCPEALLQDVCKALRADLVTLRKDAERYRWLKNNGFAFAENVRVGAVTTAGADEVIDAKMYKVVAVG